MVCKYLEIPIRTIQRWENAGTQDKRKGAKKFVKRRLSVAERSKIVKICTSKRFKNHTPYTIVAILAEEGEYIGSESTIYRVLREQNMLTHRRNEKKRKGESYQEEIVATGPKQLCSWDISYLKTNIKGVYYYLYMFIDVWSRKIIGWGIYETESGEIAKALILKIGLMYCILHSDNGGPMRYGGLRALLEMLHVIQSFSRPNVSNDNAYSESLFKTIKYNVGYPRQFEKIEDAREWMGKFVNWYNKKHRHSGIGYVTPEERESGKDKEIFVKRNATMKKAYEKNPERWSKNPKTWKYVETVVLKKGATKEK